MQWLILLHRLPVRMFKAEGLLAASDKLFVAPSTLRSQVVPKWKSGQRFVSVLCLPTRMSFLHQGP